ncbi:MAG: glycosyltransferase family 4 protein [Deltaproteobacteria bacterium]|nr:glycosyltransferase family 4 protein [Deltaproteobacteria bacterium]
MSAKQVLVLDTGKEWGGGTNSLLELLKRIDRGKYHFTALFYNNYKKGNESDIKTEIEKLGIDFLLLEQNKQAVVSKLLKEASRLIFFFSKKLKKHFIFLIDYHFRIKPNSKNIADTLKRLKINLIYMNNQPSSNLEGILAAKDASIPCIQHSRISAELNRVEVNAANNWLTKTICVSQGVKEVFIKQGVDASKCEVVYNGIDPNVKPATAVPEIRKEWGIKDNEILIGTVGSLIKRKRISDLIDVLAKLQLQEGSVALYGQRKSLGINPNATTTGDGGSKDPPLRERIKVRGIIVGDGPEKDNLQKLVLKMGLQDRIIFTGFQTNAISYINAMDIFVLPSENEGLPRVVLEAMLMAKPVVACNITGPSELVVYGETGFLVPVRNPEMLANALLKLVASNDLRRGMGEKGRMRVIERFAIDKYVTGVSNIFKEVLG